MSIGSTGSVAQVLECDFEVSLNSSRSIRFTFELIPLGKV